MKDIGTKPGFNGRQLALWITALVLGGILGTLGCGWLNEFFNFIASVYTRLFQFVAVPTIALAVTTTLALLGARKNTGRIFLHTISYTLLTTAAAALVGLLLYKVIQPGNLPLDAIQQGNTTVPENLGSISYYTHILSVIPNNILAPLSSGNVLSILLVAVAVGLVLSMKRESENIQVLLKGILGMQEVLFALIKGLVWTLPLGIVAFAAQLSAQVSAGFIIGSLGKYVAVVLGGNLIQFFIILPLHAARGADGALHQEFGRDSAGDGGLRGKQFEGEGGGGALRTADLLHHQHERLCGLHPGHVALCDAERRLGVNGADNSALVFHFDRLGHWKRGSADGMLFSDAVADVRHSGAHRHSGDHPADLHDHRHD